MKQLKALWELMRLEHGVMLFLAILIGALIIQKGLPPIDKLIFAFLTAMFLEASTFALNDYFDLEIDKKNKRYDRPLARGDLKPKTALYLFYILFPLGILASWMVNTTCFIIATITAFLSIVYDVKMKKTKLLGNFYIAYIMAIPFIFGGTVVSTNIPFIIYLLAAIAFLAGSGREIMKDVMDYKGDKEKGVKSFPKYIGTHNSNIVAAFFYIVAIAISLIPFFILIDEAYHLDYYYLTVVLITDVMLLYTSVNLIFKQKVNMKFHRKFTLVAIFIGLLAFLIGAFIA